MSRRSRSITASANANTRKRNFEPANADVLGGNSEKAMNSGSTRWEPRGTTLRNLLFGDSGTSGSSGSFTSSGSSNFSNSCETKMEETPFQLTEYVLRQPTRLANGVVKADFLIPSRFHIDLMPRKPPPKYTYQILLRVYPENRVDIQEIGYPSFMTVTVDQYNAALPDAVTVQQGRSKVTKRPPIPVDLTQLCAPLHRAHSVEIRWSNATGPCNFIYTIVLVKNVDVEYLRNSALEKPKLSVETLDLVRRNFGDDDDISVDHLHLSLLDPYNRQILDIPARSTSCDHIQCFDLNNFISINEKKTKWKCPCCNKAIQFSTVRVCNFIQKILTESGKKLNEVEILKSGKWKKVGGANDDAICLDSSDDEGGAPPAKMQKFEAPKPQPAQPPLVPKSEPSANNGFSYFMSHQMEPISSYFTLPPAPPPPPSSSMLPSSSRANITPEVITLSDSDDDEPSSSIPATSSVINQINSMLINSVQRTSPESEGEVTSTPENFSSPEPEVITLESSDEDQTIEQEQDTRAQTIKHSIVNGELDRLLNTLNPH